MIEYHYQTEFRIEDEDKYTKWIILVLDKHGREAGDINYIFCSDTEVLEMNREYLNHDYFTDILTFPWSTENFISGDLYISADRVIENAKQFNEPLDREMARVMIHGLLHILGYDDLSDQDVIRMRNAEESALEMFHVKQL